MREGCSQYARQGSENEEGRLTVLSAIAIDSKPALESPTSATIFKCQAHNTRSPPPRGIGYPNIYTSPLPLYSSLHARPTLFSLLRSLLFSPLTLCRSPYLADMRTSMQGEITKRKKSGRKNEKGKRETEKATLLNSRVFDFLRSG